MTNSNLFVCFLNAWKKTFKYKGRASRYEYWAFIFVNVIMFFALMALSFVLPLSVNNVLSWGIYLYMLLAFFPSLSLSVRRIHDINKSGWYVAVYFIITTFTGIVGDDRIATPEWLEIISALLAIICLIWMLVWTMRKGTDGENKYGEPSLSETKTQKWFSTLFPLLICVLPIITAFISGIISGMNNYRESNSLGVVEEFAVVATNTMEFYKAQGNYDGLNNTSAIANHLIPEPMITEDGTIAHSLGGKINLEGKGKNFDMILDNLPYSACLGMSMSLQDIDLFTVASESCTDCQDDCVLHVTKK